MGERKEGRGTSGASRFQRASLREMTEAVGWLERPRQGLLILGGKSMPYPPKPVGFLRGLGARTSLSMAWGFATRPGRLQSFRTWEHDRSRIPEEDDGFESFVLQRVGRSAYNRFYRPYVEKVWGMDPSQISRTVAKQRVSTSSPLSSFRRALSRSRRSDSLFLYPREGMCSLIHALREEAIEMGVEFHAERNFDAQTEQGFFEHVLFSGHLQDLVPSSGLAHRGLYLLHLAYPKGIVGDNDTWYAPETKYWFGRVSQPSRFSPELDTSSHDILCVEIPEGRWGKGRDFLSEMDAICSQLATCAVT